MTRRLLAVLVLVSAGAVLVPAGAHAARLTPCPQQAAFGCATLRVPLDRAGPAPGTIALRYAAQRRRPPGGRVLIALSGGPGQPGVDLASSFAQSLEPLLRRYRLVVLDQRGTGGSGLLVCPGVQRLRALDPFTPSALAACARGLGPRRAFYSTADTVLDLEALRKELGVDRVALMGISYGTHVALAYARAFPDRVDRLILDSVVGPDGPDGFLRDSYRALPRVLRDQCAGSRCDDITSDPVADLAAVVGQVKAGVAVRASVFDTRGRRRTVGYADAQELVFLIFAGDLNPFLQAALPAAFTAAARGDVSLLLRLRRVAQGTRIAARDLSFGLNVATGCADARMPYALTTPLAERPALVQAALASIDPGQIAPFDPQTVLATGYVDDCLLWPEGATRAPFTGPLPDVPTLLLGGRLDVRTPIENALATRAQLPRSSVVALRGSGHDVIDSDVTGCVARALARFSAGRRVGTPCAGRDNAVAVLPVPPRTLRDFRAAPGVGGTRGRALFAALDTVQDAQISALQTLYSGVAQRGGGLRGGRYAATDDARTVRLYRYAYVRGLRVSGTVTGEGYRLRGRVSLSGPRAASGFLVLDGRGGASGRLGGRAVVFRERRAGGASAERGRRVRRVRGPSLPAPALRTPGPAAPARR